MGNADSSSSEIHRQRALIDRQIKALENERARLQKRINAEEQRIIVANRQGASRATLLGHARTIQGIEKERSVMQRAVTRLQNLSASLIGVQSTEILNNHLAQFHEVVSEVSLQLVIPELGEMRRAKQALDVKSDTLNEFMDDEHNPDTEAEEEDESKVKESEILDRVLGPSLLNRLEGISVPKGRPKIKKPKPKLPDRVEHKSAPVGNAAPLVSNDEDEDGV